MCNERPGCRASGAKLSVDELCVVCGGARFRRSEELGMDLMTYSSDGQRAIGKVSSASCCSAGISSFPVSWYRVVAIRRWFRSRWREKRSFWGGGRSGREKNGCHVCRNQIPGKRMYMVTKQARVEWRQLFGARPCRGRWRSRPPAQPARGQSAKQLCLSGVTYGVYGQGQRGRGSNRIYTLPGGKHSAIGLWGPAWSSW